MHQLLRTSALLSSAQGGVHSDGYRHVRRFRGYADILRTRADVVLVRFSNRPAGSSVFRLSTSSSAMSPTGSRFSSDSAQGPSNMGFEDEVEQSFGRPRRQYDGRSKRTNDLTSSIVP